ncbi:MAG TPA: TniQ family protein [Noviherbaspirillum sp.]
MLLIRTPGPNKTESLLGYALRLSVANGYETPWHIFSHAGIEANAIRGARFPYEKLAAVLGIPDAELEQLSYAGVNKGGRREYRLLGHTLAPSPGYSYLRLTSPAFCPDCVREHGYIDALWDMRFIIACPVHKRTLLECCSECMAPISWLRPALLTCRCGASLDRLTTTEIDESIIDLMSLIHAKLHRKPLSAVRNLTGMPMAKLYPLKFKYLLPVLATIGKYNKRDRPIERILSKEVVASTASALSNWPENYVTLLHRIRREDPQCRGSMFPSKQLDMFYSSLFRRRRNAFADGAQEKRLFRDDFPPFQIPRSHTTTGNFAVDFGRKFAVPPEVKPVPAQPLRFWQSQGDFLRGVSKKRKA